MVTRTEKSIRKPEQDAKAVLEKMARGEKIPATIPYVVQGWAFGDELAMVFLAGEVVVDYSLRLKKELGKIWVTGYANDVMAYIPSLRVLKEGGYAFDVASLPTSAVQATILPVLLSHFSHDVASKNGKVVAIKP